jgi:FMN phosphatase YigB (HAD superfamily)
VPEPSLDVSRLRAVIFDLDGTLYRQGPLRRAMALRLLRAHVVRPAAGLRTMRTIAAYRRAQEELRGTQGNGDLAEAQLVLTVERTGYDRDLVAHDINRWVEEAPLDLLARFVQPGLGALLAALRSQGLKLGVLSDYQALPKLQALGIVDLFDVVLWAQQPEIGVFKPHPLGLLVALHRLDVTAEQALYVGDRAEVDAVAAAAARVPCVILSKSGNVRTGKGFMQITCLSELRSRLQPV